VLAVYFLIAGFHIFLPTFPVAAKGRTKHTPLITTQKKWVLQ